MGSVDGARIFQSVSRWFRGAQVAVRTPVGGEASGAVGAGLPQDTRIRPTSAAVPAVRPALPRPGEEPTPRQIQAERVYRQLGLTDDEYDRVVSALGRLPNYAETGMFGVLWSEHCSYKSSKVHLRKFPTSGPQVLQGPGENAGIVEIGDGWAVAFKMESHNHPSAIEPVQGAATGVGGILRDVFTMGARPIAFLDSLRFGPLDDPHVRDLFRGVVSGIGMYGNCVGIPTVGGEVSFDPSYTANPLVNAMCVGVLRTDAIVRGVAAGVGNPVFVVGARTGRDGIHGATFASAEDPHSKERSAVQVGDPFLGKLLMEACLELIATGSVVGIQDMGAAGLTSSSAEMASRAGGGMVLHLDRVPVREQGITPYEMLLSESQERMLVVLERGQEEQAFRILRKWGLEVAEIGRVTDTGRLECRFGDEVVADVPVRLLVDDAPVYERPVAAPHPEVAATALADGRDDDVREADLADALCQLLAHPSVADKRWVYRQYDTSVRTSTVTGPGSDAAIVRLPDSDVCVVLATDGNSRYTALNPRRGGAIAVAEAARNITCAGGEPLALTNCLNFGNPENPDVMYQFAEATAGMAEACEALATPVVSGNVSLYNQSQGRDIHPTPIIGMVGRMARLEDAIPSHFQQPGSTVLLVGPEDERLDGSLYAELRAGRPVGDAPAFALDTEVQVQRLVRAWMRQGKVRAAHDVSEGGLGVALAEMCFEGPGVPPAGVTVQLPANVVRRAAWLFSEGQSRIVLEVCADDAQAMLAEARAAGVPARLLGRVGGTDLVVQTVHGETVLRAATAALEQVYRSTLPAAMAAAAPAVTTGPNAVPTIHEGE
ncbi:MAG: phosphoribosylformylglycinamidine synthase subunit PurL [Alicyclobacillus sp.]|nr:phosphoribosylformylglycinamidine synthase subunit PurL [Alicyclobacillus sp.]